jgi:hypothetical protein
VGQECHYQLQQHHLLLPVVLVVVVLLLPLCPPLPACPWLTWRASQPA